MAVNESPTQHADHDELRIVAYAAGDLEEAELATATELVSSCSACARLATDLRLIRAATASLPVPRRTRDFRLSEADAARLRPTGWRRFLAPLASSRFAFTQPLAAALVTLGLAGLLVGTAPGLFSGAASSPAGGAAVERAAAPASEAMPSADARGEIGRYAPQALVPSAAPVPSAADAIPPAGGTAPMGDAKLGVSFTASDAAPTGGLSPLVLGSVILLIGGVGLLLLRWSARRLTDG